MALSKPVTGDASLDSSSLVSHCRINSIFRAMNRLDSSLYLTCSEQGSDWLDAYLHRFDQGRR